MKTTEEIKAEIKKSEEALRDLIVWFTDSRWPKLETHINTLRWVLSEGEDEPEA